MKNVGDLCREKDGEIFSIAPDATVYEAVRMMADKDIGALLVFEGDRLAGVFTERDYARRVILENRMSRETSVSEIMDTDFTPVSPDDDLEYCMEIMTNRRQRHLPVMEGEKTIGIISIGDIVKGIIEHKEYMIKEMEKYVRGHHR